MYTFYSPTRALWIWARLKWLNRGDHDDAATDPDPAAPAA
jgi:hypothetical protein